MPAPYERSARYYDRIYGHKPYADEAAQLHALLQELRPGARALLEVGCGTGAYLAHLRAWYEVEGVDASPAMLAVARGKDLGVPLHEGDQRTLDLGRTYDCVVSLFSGIGYVRSVEELEQAVTAMARHVTPGGWLAVEPWFRPDQWKSPGDVHGGMPVDEPDLKIARFVVSTRRDRFAVTPMHHLIAEPSGVTHFVETHELLLATADEYAGAFRQAGLEEVRYEPEMLVRGLWLGRRGGRSTTHSVGPL